MRQRSTMFRGERMAFRSMMAGVGGVPIRDLGQTYQDQMIENARYRLVAAQGDYDAAQSAYMADPTDANFKLMSAAADRIVEAQRQITGTRDAARIFIQAQDGAGLPLSDIKFVAIGDDGSDLIVQGTPRSTGPGGRLELLIDSHATEATRKITIHPVESSGWTPDQKVFDVSGFANSEVVFTRGAVPGAGGMTAKSGYSPLLLIGGLAIAAAIFYFTTKD